MHMPTLIKIKLVFGIRTIVIDWSGWPEQRGIGSICRIYELMQDCFYDPNY